MYDHINEKALTNMIEKILSLHNLALTHLDLSSSSYGYISEKLVPAILPSIKPTLLTLNLGSTNWWSKGLSEESGDEG